MAPVAIKSFYSSFFLAAAQEAAGNLEAELARSGAKPRFSLAHQGQVLTAAVQTAPFPEAANNELLDDAGAVKTNRTDEMNKSARRNWAALWIALDEGSRGDVLSKYRAALVAADAHPFDQGAEPYQSARLVVRLRNHLVHFKPSWGDTGETGQPREQSEWGR